MIRMIQSVSVGHAKAYFSQALSQADYYLGDQELAGRFEGKLAERLGLAGEGKSGLATKEDFHALCDNINPATGNPLTPRTKEERRVGYDLNFHCPKSVSILHVISQDDHILQAFEKSVAETMRDIEADAKTRVRIDKQYEDRETGELAWASFTHQTARPTKEAAPDPHLHSHCFVFNATYDEEEKKIKAGQFGDIKRDMPYYQARFHKRFSDSLIELGYQVRRTEKSFEIAGVPQKVIDLFSKRTNEIGQVAKEKGITSASELAELGARTRAKKQKGLSMSELVKDWKRQIHEADIEASEGEKAVRFAKVVSKEDLEPHLANSAEKCVDHAVSHCFERASVMHDRRVLEQAYRHSLGDKAVTLDGIGDRFKEDGRLMHVEDGSRTMCTTREVWLEEKRMVALARQGQGKMLPLYRTAPNISLDGDQAEAVRHVLTTPHRVSIIRGAAGTGKTTLMKEAVSHIEKAGRKVVVVAPTSQASRGVLKEEGFEGAQTVAKLLMDHKLQDSLQDQVLWVDEAGLLGTKDMSALLSLAEKKNARLILGGDTRQHASVVRGDALRILNTVAGIKTAEVSRIYRQKNEQYRKAVEDLSKGKVATAFEKLDGLGSIQEVDPLKPNEQLVEDYLEAVKKGKSALVISPTHQQSEETTKAIREGLRKAGLLGNKEITATRLQNLNLTEAEKADVRSYQKGQMVQFNQNLPGIRRGSLWQVDQVEGQAVHIKDENGRYTLLPVEKASDFDLYRKGEIKLSKGDSVRITRNGFDESKRLAMGPSGLKKTKPPGSEQKPFLSFEAGGKRLNNGQLLEVLKVSKSGEITLRNLQSKVVYTLGKDFGHLAHGHCITSHASQGKTVDEVFIAQPSGTFPATDMKQFYVSVSRAREKARIYTDDKEELLQHAKRLGDRTSAIELLAGKETKEKDLSKEAALYQVRQQINPPEPLPEKRQPELATPSIPTPYPKPPTIDRDYEPGI